MRFGIVVLMLAMFVFPLFALSCVYDNNPNVQSDLRMQCNTNTSLNSRCYAISSWTGHNLVVAQYPEKTFDYDKENYYVPDAGGVFVVTASMNGAYEAKNNYTFNVTCFNATSYDTNSFTVLTALPRSPNWIGEWGEWIVQNARYLFFGSLVLFIVFGAAFVILRLKR